MNTTAITAFFLLLPLLRMFAQQDLNFDHLRNAATENEYPGAAVVVLYDSTDVDVQDSGLSYVRMHKLVKVLSGKGARDLNSVTFDYDPLSADVEVLRVRVYRKDGSVHTLTPSDVYDYAAPARAIYWGARQKLVSVGWLEPGDAVETLVFRKGFTYALLGEESPRHEPAMNAENSSRSAVGGAAGNRPVDNASRKNSGAGSASPESEDDDSRFVPPMKGHYYDIVEFWSSVPVKEKVYRVLVPENKPLQFEVYSGELSSYVHFHPKFGHRLQVDVNPAVEQYPTERQNLHPTSGMYTREGKITYCWYKRGITPFKGEPDMVSPSDVATKLLLSTSPDWYAKSTWFHGVNENFGSFTVTPDVQEITDELLDGVTDELEKISILNHWVAEEIRYSGISMGEGEGYTLHTGAMTFLDRCGVCKDKAGMLVTMLRAAGFESYPAMTMAGSRIERIPADQFNHSVTVVKRGNGHWMLLDPTWIPGAREMWSSAEQQQEFLMGIPGGADVMSTPISPARNHYMRMKNTASLSADGTLEGVVEIEAEGQSDGLMRRAFTRGYLSGREDTYSSMLVKAYPLAEIQRQTIPDPNDLSLPYHVRIEYRIPAFARTTGDGLQFIPLLAGNTFGDYYHAPELSTRTDMETRKFGFRQRCSRLVELDETITVPAGMRAERLPEKNATTSLGSAASFQSAVTLEGNTVRFTAKHRMEKRVYDAEDWPEFRASLLHRTALADSPVILTK
jgi:transglutaminase-like putative cysteine protease